MVNKMAFFVMVRSLSAKQSRVVTVTLKGVVAEIEIETFPSTGVATFTLLNSGSRVRSFRAKVAMPCAQLSRLMPFCEDVSLSFSFTDCGLLRVATLRGGSWFKAM